MEKGAAVEDVNHGEDPREPNAETRRAMEEAEAKELGLVPDDAPGFWDAEGLMAFLDGE